MIRRRSLLALSFVVLSPGAGRAELPPGAAVDERTVCLECHDLAAELAARVPHAPAAEGRCSACHNPHVSRFASLLRERPGPLCIRCHEAVAKELELAVVHGPVAEGRCSSCHPPHGAAEAHLLAQPGAELCVTCHSQVGEWRSREVRHAPFARGACGSCHRPHASAAAGLLRASGAALCLDCHRADAAFRAVHGGYPVERASCETCHDPHASSRRGLLRSNLHEPFTRGDCGDCHAGGAGAQPFALRRPQAALCGDCHEAEAEASRSAPFGHVSAGGGDCTACHNPHAGEGEALLQRRGDQVCLTCHDPGGASSGEAGRYATHADVACASCHQPHGGAQPLLFARDVLAVCGDCHEHEHGISHPQGEGTLDPRNGMPMDCTSCHGIHRAPYPKYMHASDERDLCIGCHKEMARRGQP